jgi:hypothetical protein
LRERLCAHAIHPLPVIQLLASVGLGLRAEAGRSVGDDAAARTIDPRNSTSHPGSYGCGYQQRNFEFGR